MEYGIVFKFSLPIVYPDDLEFCFETVVSANTTTRTCFLSVNSGDYSTGFGDSVIRRLYQVNFWWIMASQPAPSDWDSVDLLYPEQPD